MNSTIALSDALRLVPERNQLIAATLGVSVSTLYVWHARAKANEEVGRVGPPTQEVIDRTVELLDHTIARAQAAKQRLLELP